MDLVYVKSCIHLLSFCYSLYWSSCRAYNTTPQNGWKLHSTYISASYNGIPFILDGKPKSGKSIKRMQKKFLVHLSPISHLLICRLECFRWGENRKSLLNGWRNVHGYYIYLNWNTNHYSHTLCKQFVNSLGKRSKLEQHHHQLSDRVDQVEWV